MKRELVGSRRGERVINWPAVLVLGLAVGFVSGCSAAGTWFLLTGEFSLVGTLVPVVICLGWPRGPGSQKASWCRRTNSPC
jgi:hypothetical protein